MNNPPAPPASGATAFPPGLHNAFLFATFNALSFQVVLGSPMVLYAKSLGASATVLGIVAGMMPLLVIFQIPAAAYVPRYGYKRFVVAGWSARVLFIFGMAVVPILAPVLDPTARLSLILLLLFFFNLSRGISSCAWLPWMTLLVPPALRGKYLVRDAAVQNIASFITFLIAAAALSGATESWQFSLLFGFSAIMGAISLNFLKRIPDATAPDELSQSKQPVPWMAMLGFAPFKKLLRAVVAWSVTYGGMTAFTVAYLKGEAGMSETRILLVTSVMFIGGWSSLWVIGAHLDRFGSKPILRVAFGAWLLVLVGWVLVSGRVFRPDLALLLSLQFFMGLFGALVNMANTRLAMAVIPPMGRNHFFAIYSVVSNVTLGLAPIAWGLLIDGYGMRQVMALGLEWNRYTVFFAAAALVLVATIVVARQLEEPEAGSMEDLLRELLIQSPQRFWLRFWPRQ
jgi:MFS family permease